MIFNRFGALLLILQSNFGLLYFCQGQNVYRIYRVYKVYKVHKVYIVNGVTHA